MRGFPFDKFINFIVWNMAELPGGNGAILGMEFDLKSKSK